MKKNRFNSILFKLIFSVFIFFTLFIFIEILIRVTGIPGISGSWIKSDPDIGWRNIPEHRYVFNKENDHPIIGKMNSYGWRDHEWLLIKTEQTYRVAVLGDSYIEAFQVEEDKTFLTITENILSQGSGINYELMNFGRSGFTQTEEYLIITSDIEKFNPEMYILFFLPSNDIRDISKSTAQGIRPFYIEPGHQDENIVTPYFDKSFTKSNKYKIKCFLSIFRRHSAIINFIVELILKRTNIVQASKEQNEEKLPPYFTLGTDNPDQKCKDNYNINKKLILKISDYCKEHKKQFLLVLIDDPSYLPDNEKKYLKLDPSFSWNYFENDLQSFSMSHNINFLSLQTIARKSYLQNKIELHWSHWNYQGHEFVAQSLANKIKIIISQNSKSNN
ncbi:SGNH/GDSL hydrolase family protein [Candidatus Dependentiae bacterium]|nr:SGNH/GDSL hydrolase family protein [Candidatus Dependentiae bacterium]